MPKCQCGAQLPGRRRKCDACKKRPGKSAQPPAKKPSAPEIPAGLHDRGRALWVALGLTLDSGAGQLALEACRLADRLDQLDNYLAGRDAWLHLVEQIEGLGRFEIVLDKALAETRQQQATLNTLLNSIKAAVAKGSPQPAPAPTAGVASPLDQLAARRQGQAKKIG